MFESLQIIHYEEQAKQKTSVRKKLVMITSFE